MENQPPILEIFFVGFLLFQFIAVIIIDFKHYKIPNLIVVVSALSGFANILIFEPGRLFYSISFAIFIWFFLGSLSHMYFKRFGRIGLGQGDVKFFAASSLWLPILDFPNLVFLSSATALIFIICKYRLSVKRHSKIAFGPFIAGSLILLWIFEKLDVDGVLI